MRADQAASGRRLLTAAVVGVLVALLTASVASADKEKIRMTAAGRAAARAAVVTRADVGPVAGWSGGFRKPDLSGKMPCTSFHPKQSDLVLIGAASSVWKHPGLELVSQAQVLASAKMVRLDWRRTVLAPQVMACLRSGLAKGLPASQKLVSLRRLSFPRVATYTRAYQALIDVNGAGGTVRVVIDLVLFGRGQTEVTLSTTAPLAAAPSIKAADVRLAARLAARIRL